MDSCDSQKLATEKTEKKQQPQQQLFLLTSATLCNSHRNQEKEI
jgi:hypothetical protein